MKTIIDRRTSAICIWETFV